MSGGTALVRAADKIVARGKIIAAALVGAAPCDIKFDRGVFSVAGSNRAVRIEEVARASFDPHRIKGICDLGLVELAIVAPDKATFPNGCHVCEVEIDPETGLVTLVSYVVVDDVGRVMNPLLLEGQLHGGIAQGAGQILLEEVSYDPDNGQLVTASFLDYGMPRAHDLPSMQVISNPSPTPTNPLGAKGAGEAGTVGALPAVMNAIVDALQPFGIKHIDMPATPQRIWMAIKDAQQSVPPRRI
jgi:carbon-monoxide dehydrogenase large subunit